MSGMLIYSTLLLTVAIDNPLTYQQAHAESLAAKRPLLVLVGADWCPACRQLKDVTLRRMQREGKLKDLVIAVVDVDREPHMSAQLMRSSSIPQLVLYAPATAGWHRLQLDGAQNASRVAAIIERGLELWRASAAAERVAATQLTDSPSE